MTLAADLRSLAGQAMPERTAARLAQALAECRSDLAITDLTALLDPDGRRSKWSVCLEIAARLRRFEATAWPRIEAGNRPPKDVVETSLAAILRAGGGTSAKRIADRLP